MISVKSVTIQSCPLSLYFFNIVFEVFTIAIRQQKENKGIQTGKEEVKIALFADHIIIYISDPQNSSRELLQLINTFSDVAEYNINSKKSVSYFLLVILIHPPCLFYHPEQYGFFIVGLSFFFFTFPGETCSSQWLGMTGPCLTWGEEAVTGSQRLTWWYLVFFSVFYWSTFIVPMSGFATPQTYSRRLGLPILAIFREDIISKNSLPMISSEMSYSTTIKTFGILVSLHTIGNCFIYSSFSSTIKCLSILFMQDPFMYWWWYDF